MWPKPPSPCSLSNCTQNSVIQTKGIWIKALQGFVKHYNREQQIASHVYKASQYKWENRQLHLLDDKNFKGLVASVLQPNHDKGECLWWGWGGSGYIGGGVKHCLWLASLLSLACGNIGPAQNSWQKLQNPALVPPYCRCSSEILGHVW